MAIHYSKYFKVKHKEFTSRGVYNAFLDKDSLLHIDPLLLKDCQIPEFKKAYEEFFDYFSKFVPLVRCVHSEQLSDRFFKKIVGRFTFKEIPNTGLGFSNDNTSGRGISGSLSIQLAHSACAIIKAGLVEPEIFGLMQLIEDNMAADRISDMTITILQKRFLQYTERIATELNLPVKVFQYSYDCAYQVPFYKEDPIYFIPMTFLVDIPVAHSFEDIDDVCNYNNRLKFKVAEVIGVTWSEYKEYKKKDWKNLILNNHSCYVSAIEYYKNLSGVPYNFDVDKKEQYNDVLLQEIFDDHPFVAPTNSGLSPAEEIKTITIAICNQFKKLVEQNRISEIFWRDNRTPDETDWQMLLYAIADTYKKAGGYDCSITREDNPGVGEIDFHITRGAKANTVIEIKRSGNANLVHGYRTQLAAYMKAESADTGLFMIIIDEDNYDNIAAKLAGVQTDMRDKGEYVPEIIYINGRKQFSASDRKYSNPVL